MVIGSDKKAISAKTSFTQLLLLTYMYKLILPVVLLFSFNCMAQDNSQIEEEAEEPEENTATIKRYKYEIGTDIKWIFMRTVNNYYPNSSHTYSYSNNDGMRLFARINKSKRIPQKYRLRKYAYRFGLRLNGAFTFFSDLDTVAAINAANNGLLYSDRQKFFYVLAETGYEVQNQFRKFQLFYGADVGVSYNRYSYDIFVLDRVNLNQYIKTSDVKHHSYSFAFSPLVGIKYFIHSRVSVSGEARVNLGMYYSSSKDGYFGTHIKTGGLNVWTDPLYALNLNYYFNR
jgi:hypothetical protein